MDLELRGEVDLQLVDGRQRLLKVAHRVRSQGFWWPLDRPRAGSVDRHRSARGIVDRFRSLPIARSAYLLGHMLAELAAAVLAIAVLAASGLIIGWRIDTGLPDAIAGFALLILISFTMLWIGTLLGVSARSPDAVQGVVFVLAFPLTLIASAYIPLGGLPGALRTVAEYNPVSAFAAAVRTLFGNPTAVPADAAWPLHHPVLVTVAWCVALLAFAIPTTLAAYRRRTTTQWISQECA